MKHHLGGLARSSASLDPAILCHHPPSYLCLNATISPGKANKGGKFAGKAPRISKPLERASTAGEWRCRSESGGFPSSHIVLPLKELKVYPDHR